MSDLITLSKSAPEFESYLLGTFSKDKRALPLKTLNVNSKLETVTFRIVPLANIYHPHFLLQFFKTFKIRNIILILLPMFLIISKNINEGIWFDPLILIFTFLGVLMAFFAINFRNDFMDHMRGVDRIFETSGSRAIQKGWITADRAKALSNVFLVAAILFALVLAVAVPQLWILLVVSLGIGLWAQFKRQNSFKYQIGGELAIFLMLGPLLTIGYQMTLGNKFDFESLWIGCIWGWAVLFVVHLRNLQQILPSLQAGFSNTVNWLGFDNGRRMLARWWGCFIFLNVVYHWYYATPFWGLFSTIVLSVFSIRFVLRLKNLSSSVGSELVSIYRYGVYLFLLASSLWVSECLWQLVQ